MKKIKLALVAMAAILCFACEGKTDMDFSIVPVKGANGEYQYIDVSQKGKIVINPQFGQAHIFRDGLALVKTSGWDGKYGYIDRNGKYIIAPTYDFAQDFSEGVAWMQMEDQPPMLIDTKGKILLQIDSLVEAKPFNNGIAAVAYYSEDNIFGMFIDKKGKPVAISGGVETSNKIMNDDIYAFKSTGSKKWGYKNKNGDIIVNEQFDLAKPFFDGMAVVESGGKYGAINKKGEYLINPQYNLLGYDSDGLFYAKVGKKVGWVNKKGEMAINPQFDDCWPFYGNKLAPVKMGSKWAYVDKKGQIIINPQFDAALPFYGDYAMVANNGDRIGFINQKGEFAVPPLYDGTRDDVLEYKNAIYQNLARYDEMYQKESFLTYKKLREKKQAYYEAKREKAAIDAANEVAEKTRAAPKDDNNKVAAKKAAEKTRAAPADDGRAAPE
jgi:hypothetical protein